MDLRRRSVAMLTAVEPLASTSPGEPFAAVLSGSIDD